MIDHLKKRQEDKKFQIWVHEFEPAAKHFRVFASHTNKFMNVIEDILYVVSRYIRTVLRIFACSQIISIKEISVTYLYIIKYQS